MVGGAGVRIAVTGSAGLLGWHAAGRLHARICAARYAGAPEPFALVTIDHADFADAARLAAKLAGVDVVLHFAGVNRGEAEMVRVANPEIARKLVAACQSAGCRPHFVYANSVHAQGDSDYGLSKREAGDILAGFAGDGFCDLVLPHIFGEGARPDYNNVTATLIDRIWKSEVPQINAAGRISLLHAGEAAELAIAAGLERRGGRMAPQGRDVAVPALYDKLMGFHALYARNIFPAVVDPFDLALFNALRSAAFPKAYPLVLEPRTDARGMLFESAKGGNASQSFLSTTHPGQSRGDHFHLDLVERFVVVAGEAVIRLRRVLGDKVHAFRVSGERPVAIDMPPLHTHHIENIGSSALITYFWAHRLFDPARPDTYADPVLQPLGVRA